MMKEEYMRQSIRLAVENIRAGGGPFGAVIVKDGEVIATGVNRVTANNDPTAHAEVQAIRAACSKLGTFSLDGCQIYSSCEPCPMCLGAIYWARISHLYYGGTQHDADSIGFGDAFIYKELAKDKRQRTLVAENLLHDEALEPFKVWAEKTDKVEY